MRRVVCVVLVVGLFVLIARALHSPIRERFAPIPSNTFAVSSKGLSNSLSDSSSPNTTSNNDSLLSIQNAQARDVFQIYSDGRAASRLSSDEYVRNVMRNHNTSLQNSIDIFQQMADKRKKISLQMKPPSKASGRIDEFNPLLSNHPSPINAQRMLTVDVKAIPLTYDILRGSFRGMSSKHIPTPPNPRSNP